MKQDKTVASTLSKRRSIFWLSQNLTDGAGNALVDPQALYNALQKELPHGSFWALIKHDKDPDDDNPDKIKPAHYHIFIRTPNNNLTISDMSKLLGIRPEQFVLPEKIRHNNYRVKGLDADAHCVQYMTHQHADTKAPYDSKLIMTSDRAHLDHLLAIEIVPPGAKMEVVRSLIESIVSNRTTALEYCSSDSFDPVLYIDHFTKIQNAEKTRVKLHPQSVHKRVVIFVSGYGSGCGKTSLSIKLAEELAIRAYRAPQDINARSQQPFVFVMSPETGWNGYSSQPIMILDDIKPAELKKTLGSASAVKTIFDPHPLAISYNVKNSIVLPQCEYIIVNSIYDFSEYIDKLRTQVFTDEDVTQYYRRFAARLYIANEDRVRFSTSQSGFFQKDIDIASIYFPVVLMINAHSPREWFSKAFAPIVDVLLAEPLKESQSASKIDFDLLGYSPI